MSSATQQYLFGPTPDAEQSQWFTPDWLAERVVKWARVDDKRVIELGAGDGAFVRPLVNAGAKVVAVERDPRFAGALHRWVETEHLQTFVKVHEADALTIKFGRDFDLYVGNPPYEDDADIAFVERGLDLAPRCVVVLRLVFLAGQERYRRIWSKHHLRRIAYLPERPAFIGEKSGGARADFAVFDIGRGPAPERRALGGDGHVVASEWWVR